jgi:hypothetical protein
MRLPLLAALGLISASCQTTRPPAHPQTPSEEDHVRTSAAAEAKDPAIEAAKKAATEAYEEGKEALLEKDGKTAIEAFAGCLRQVATNVDCQWELGWASFLDHDFAAAKAAWEKVKVLQPDRPGVAEVLKRIDGHLDYRTRSLALRAEQPASFRPALPPEPAGKSQKKRKKKHPPGPKRVLIHAVGDTMLGTNFPGRSMLPEKGVNPLQDVKALLKGSDITFANHEGTLCNQKTEGKCDEATGACYAFRSPPRYAYMLKSAGFDVISLANNHVMDFGGLCRDQTETSMTAAGLLWSGRPGSVARFTRRGLKFSLIAFHAAPHVNSTLDLETARKLVLKEKKRKRLVIVSFHGGAEGFAALHVPKTTEVFMGENRGDVMQFAHEVVDAGADLVLGSGPHVVRGMEVYRDRLIAYSLGNFATYKAFNLWGFAGVGVILEAEIDPQGKFTGGRLIPTRQMGFGAPVYDPDFMSTDLIRLLSSEDFAESAVLVAQDGSLGMPETKTAEPVPSPPEKQ